MTAARTDITDDGRTVSYVPGQPGRVITGKPTVPPVLQRPADPFAGIPGVTDDVDLLEEDEPVDCSCLVGAPHWCQADSTDPTDYTD